MDGSKFVLRVFKSDQCQDACWDSKMLVECRSVPPQLPGSRKRCSCFSACCLAQLRPNSPRISAPSCKNPAKSVLAKVSLTERICSITGVCQLSFSRFRTLAMVGPLSGMRGRRLNENNRLCVVIAVQWMYAPTVRIISVIKTGPRHF